MGLAGSDSARARKLWIGALVGRGQRACGEGRDAGNQTTRRAEAAAVNAHAIAGLPTSMFQAPCTANACW